MIPLIEQHREEVTALCRRYRVKRLDLFGSAAQGTFRPGESDLDFLVEFESLTPSEKKIAYFDLADDLERIFQRQIDLVVVSAIRNAFFRQEIEETRVLLYAA